MSKKDKKALKMYKSLMTKYVNMIIHMDNMNISITIKEKLKYDFLKSIERIKLEYESIFYSDSQSKENLLYVLGIEVNEFNEVIRYFKDELGDKNVDSLEDSIDYINYKLGKYLKI